MKRILSLLAVALSVAAARAEPFPDDMLSRSAEAEHGRGEEGEHWMPRAAEPALAPLGTQAQLAAAFGSAAVDEDEGRVMGVLASQIWSCGQGMHLYSFSPRDRGIRRARRDGRKVDENSLFGWVPGVGYVGEGETLRPVRSGGSWALVIRVETGDPAKPRYLACAAYQEPESAFPCP